MTHHTHIVSNAEFHSTNIILTEYTKGNNNSSRTTKPKRLEWSEETAPANDDDEETESSMAPVKLEKQYSALTALTINRLDERRIPYDLILRLLEKICLEDSIHSKHSSAILVFMPGLSEIRILSDLLGGHRDFGTKMFRIYPLHSALPSESQAVVFDIPPPGVRKIVICEYNTAWPYTTLK